MSVIGGTISSGSTRKEASSRTRARLVDSTKNPTLAKMESLARRRITVHAASYFRLAVRAFARS